MRVLHVLPELSRRGGGVAVFTVESARALSLTGTEAHVVATDLAAPTSSKPRRAAPGDLTPGVDLISYELFPITTPRLGYSQELGRYLAESVAGFDVVHSHALHLWHFRQVATSCLRAGTPYVVSPHGALDPFLRSRHRYRKLAASGTWQPRALNHAAAMHVTTEDERMLSSDVAPKVPRFVVPPGIWWEHFQRPTDGAAFRDLELEGFEGDLIVSIGRISFKKGLDVLIQAMAAGEGALRRARLVIIGPDDERLTPRLERCAVQAGVADRVTIRPPIYADRRLDALRSATVWALPSYTENFGIAAVEAMAAGVPVVISDRVNLAGEARRAGAAVVVEPTPQSTAQGIEKLLEDSDRRCEIANAGRAFARLYDWPRIASQLAEMYTDIVDHHG